MRKILIIDIETTGFLNKGGRIVEVGIVELDLDNGEKKILFDEVCWEKGITKEECDSSWIVENSTLTTEDIRASKSLKLHQYNNRCQAHLKPLRTTWATSRAKKKDYTNV